MSEREKRTPFEAVTAQQSEKFWEEDEDGALRGSRLLSCETGPNAGPNRKEEGNHSLRSAAVAGMWMEQPERFLELVGYLPHGVQDIFYQYYLLGRTQTAIGETLGVTQTTVWQTLGRGIEQIVRVIQDQAAGDEVKVEMGEIGDTGDLRVRTGVGKFVVDVDEVELDKLFAPMTKGGAVS